MKKSIFSKLSKKNWRAIIIILSLLGFLLYNKGRSWARYIREEELVPICEQAEVINPQCRARPPAPLPVDKICNYFKKVPCDGCSPACPATQACCCDPGENELEIPIGRAVDQAEYLADQIVNEMGILLLRAEEESQKAQEMPPLANQCDISNCEPKCDVSSGVPSGCTTGYTCSYQGYNHTGQEIIDGGFSRQDCKNLPNNLSIDPTSVYAIFQYHNGTSGWCNIKVTVTYTPGSCEGDACPSSDIHAVQNEIDSLAQAIYESQQKIAGFVAEMEEAFEKLQKSRNRLADCVVRPFEEEAFLREEVTGKTLYLCREIVEYGIPVHSYLGENLDEFEEECYGDLFCQVREEKGEPLPYPPGPCAEDFYCCY